MTTSALTTALATADLEVANRLAALTCRIQLGATDAEIVTLARELAEAKTAADALAEEAEDMAAEDNAPATWGDDEHYLVTGSGEVTGKPLAHLDRLPDGGWMARTLDGECIGVGEELDAALQIVATHAGVTDLEELDLAYLGA